MTTVYGGDNGVKLFIKHEIIEMVYAYDDSHWGIQSIILSFTNKKQQATTKRDLVYKHLLVKHLMRVYLSIYTLRTTTQKKLTQESGSQN